ncbi:AIPR family protein [Paenibacillus naphthalenovorans]|uniref:AIPR protein n=1 Tax=Paenibacillus naphthalenovorans TaxID=162209 RepID=A0A0U2N0H3_9BACL|nr:AIPR family protein [Paenibacillus naphthalenovorans]ALS24367.1 AIPR protein [Paenibacillus naphthalenovorans]
MSKNNQILLEEIIRQERDDLDETQNLDKFFEFFSIAQVLKSYELSYDEIEAGITGESHDGGADGIYLFVNGDLVKEDETDIKGKYKKNVDIEFVIIQSKNSNSFSEDPLLKLSRLSRGLFPLDFDRNEFEGRYNSKVLESFERFRDTYISLITKKPKLKVSFIYASKGIEVHPNVLRQAEDLKNDVKSLLSDATVEVDFIGAELLLKLVQARTNDVYRLKLSENPMSSSGQVFIALANLMDYYNFITDENGNLIKHIFESNVRDYQGKTNVNNEIQETLENPGNEEFWWLNNGVTIVASAASAPGGKELIIHNPEVVNGLQTSSEIYKYFTSTIGKGVEEKRNILIRVIVPETEEARDKIIRATNSQTPIPKSSLRATDSIHRQIEDYLKPRGLYYDRRKNFYKNEGKKPKDIISVSFLAQCLMSVILQKPDFARARPSTLLEEDSAYNDLYHKNNDLHTYFILAYIGRTVELFLKETGRYTSSEINDIKFYVLYASCAQLCSNVYPSNKSLSNLSKDSLTVTLLETTSALVYDLYKVAGGNDKVAKGPKLIELLKDKLREKKL